MPGFADLLAALCLVLVLEGLFLLAGTRAFKRYARELLEMPDSTLRIAGAFAIAVGLLLLQAVR